MRRTWLERWRRAAPAPPARPAVADDMPVQAEPARSSAAAEVVDTEWYLATYPDVAASGTDPVVHYRDHGRSEGRAPNPRMAVKDIDIAALEGMAADQPPDWFETAWYRTTNRVPQIGAGDPFRHYLTQGRSDGCAPNRALNSLVGIVVRPPLRPTPADIERQIDLVVASNVFDRDWYADRYGIVARQSVAHYVRSGAFLGHDPNPVFSTLDYFEANLDVGSGGVNPLVHYITHGLFEGRPMSVGHGTSGGITARIWLNGF